ncbi:hypothetical protein OPV22_029817 [Ensete ventricosum]|uniref:C2H2-type domain-containing protein n=1 Tax=Ensete ventricosum TaxID=4639 RepID=A0AAV8PYL5_ENSVE|nr:hypothetical protein OPV22_029817 [Ensete ventricosum]
MQLVADIPIYRLKETLTIVFMIQRLASTISAVRAGNGPDRFSVRGLNLSEPISNFLNPIRPESRRGEPNQLLPTVVGFVDESANGSNSDSEQQNGPPANPRAVCVTRKASLLPRHRRHHHCWRLICLAFLTLSFSGKMVSAGSCSSGDEMTNDNEGADAMKKPPKRDIRRYYCQYCGICRSKKNLIRSHMLVNHKFELEDAQSDEVEGINKVDRMKRHTCNECGASFHKPAHLKQHTQSHSVEA